MFARSVRRARLARRSYSHAASPPLPPPEIATLLSTFAASPARPLNLSALLSFGRPLTEQSVLASVAYALAELPRRLATRVRALEALPFIVCTNPYIARTLATDRASFAWLATQPTPTSLEENTRFAVELERIVQRHAADVPTMAKGFQECARYMSPDAVRAFLDGAIRSRIAVRLIAEQHIALSRALADPPAAPYVGIVDPKCSPAAMVARCATFVGDLCEATLGARPAVVVDGRPDATFAYVPVHLEYILTELLKNAFRASVEAHPAAPPPVRLTLAPPPSAPPGVPTFFALRVRDAGGGVPPRDRPRIFSYAYTTARGDDDDTGPYGAQHAAGTGDGPRGALNSALGTIAGLGYGLPLSQLYASYFGGSLDLVSLDGWGSDVFLKLRCLAEVGDTAI